MSRPSDFERIPAADPAEKLAETQSYEQRIRNSAEQAKAREAEQRRAVHAVNRHARRVARAFAKKFEQST